MGISIFPLLLERRKRLRLLTREVLIAKGLAEGLNGGRGGDTDFKAGELVKWKERATEPER